MVCSMLREAMQHHDVHADALSKRPSSGAAAEAALRGGARLSHASKDSRSSASNASNPAATAAATLSGGCHESKSSFGGSGSKGFVDGNFAPAPFFRGGCAFDETTRQQYALLWKDGAADMEASRPAAAAAAAVAAAAAQPSAKPQRKAWNKGLKSQNHKSKDSAKTTSTATAATAAAAAAAAASSASLALASSAHARPDAGMLTYADVC